MKQFKTVYIKTTRKVNSNVEQKEIIETESNKKLEIL